MAVEMAETDDERDARFAPLNDHIWGEGNWIRCPECPCDANGRMVYHHRAAHGLHAKIEDQTKTKTQGEVK